MMLLAYLSMVLLMLVGILLMIIILLQRGRGGGLAGAFGGAGGQSAFGTRAGDVFTKITAIMAIIWVFLAGVSRFALEPAATQYAESFSSEAELEKQERQQERENENIPSLEKPGPEEQESASPNRPNDEAETQPPPKTPANKTKTTPPPRRKTRRAKRSPRRKLRPSEKSLGDCPLGEDLPKSSGGLHQGTSELYAGGIERLSFRPGLQLSSASRTVDECGLSRPGFLLRRLTHFGKRDRCAVEHDWFWGCSKPKRTFERGGGSPHGQQSLP